MLLCRHNYQPRLVHGAAQEHLWTGACPHSDARGMTRCWACHIPNHILLSKQRPPGVTRPPSWAGGTQLRVTGAIGDLSSGPSSLAGGAPAAVTRSDSLPPLPAALPKLQAGAGEPPGFPRDPGTAGCPLGPHTWVTSSSSVGWCGGKQVCSPEMSHNSGAHPHLWGDTGSFWPGVQGAREPAELQGDPEGDMVQGAPFQPCKGKPAPRGC